MKQLITALMIATLACGCGSSNSTEVVHTEIPVELSGNTDVQEYFATLDLFMMEYLTMIEEIVVAGKTAEEAEGDMDFASAMSMVTTVASSTLKMAPLLERLDELEKEGEVMKGELTGEELEAFIATYAKMMTRLMEMSTQLD
jgi:hypothetical protein